MRTRYGQLDLKTHERRERHRRPVQGHGSADVVVDVEVRLGLWSKPSTILGLYETLAAICPRARISIFGVSAITMGPPTGMSNSTGRCIAQENPTSDPTPSVTTGKDERRKWIAGPPGPTSRWNCTWVAVRSTFMVTGGGRAGAVELDVGQGSADESRPPVALGRPQRSSRQGRPPSQRQASCRPLRESCLDGEDRVSPVGVCAYRNDAPEQAVRQRVRYRSDKKAADSRHGCALPKHGTLLPTRIGTRRDDGRRLDAHRPLAEHDPRAVRLHKMRRPRLTARPLPWVATTRNFSLPPAANRTANRYRPPIDERCFRSTTQRDPIRCSSADDSPVSVRLDRR